MLVALPVVAGPILFITFLEHGTAFGARAASASLLGLVSLAIFALVFAGASRVCAWPVTVVIGWVTCLAVDFALSFVSVPAWAGLGFALAAALGAAKAMPAANPADVVPVELPWWDLPARAVATGALVLVVTTAAGRLGPSLTGVLAPFPTAISVVGMFALAQGGAATAIATMRGVVRGLAGFAVFCFLVAVLAGSIGAWGFVVALAAALVVQFVSRRF
jgi:hypothetical protein